MSRRSVAKVDFSPVSALTVKPVYTIKILTAQFLVFKNILISVTLLPSSALQ